MKTTADVDAEIARRRRRKDAEEKWRWQAVHVLMCVSLAACFALLAWGALAAGHGDAATALAALCGLGAAAACISLWRCSYHAAQMRDVDEEGGGTGGGATDDDTDDGA